MGRKGKSVTYWQSMGEWILGGPWPEQNHPPPGANTEARSGRSGQHPQQLMIPSGDALNSGGSEG